MGRDATMYCRTCKVSAYVGYGSYGTWGDGARTVAEFDEWASRNSEDAELIKNLRVRRFLERHDGHEVRSLSNDWTDAREGRVYELGSYGTQTNDVLVGSEVDGWVDETEPDAYN